MLFSKKGGFQIIKVKLTKTEITKIKNNVLKVAKGNSPPQTIMQLSIQALYRFPIKVLTLQNTLQQSFILISLIQLITPQRSITKSFYQKNKRLSVQFI